MKAITLKTAQSVVPMIYAYTTPEIARHNGWIKIGYTEQTVKKRVGQQGHEVDVIKKVEWCGNAVFEDGSGQVFSDHDFHRYLRKLGVENNPKNEWFRLDGATSRQYFYDFKSNRGILKDLSPVIPYALREEQKKAVEQTIDYALLHEQGEFLWNAKPRFGKSLSAYDFCKTLGAQTVLIVTNRPAIANSWYADYERFLGTESGYLFVSETEALKEKPYVLSYEDFGNAIAESDTFKLIEFVSLQDLKGARCFGGQYEKLDHIAQRKWDVLIIDEAHEGVDTLKTDVAFDRIDRQFTLHLSGTPFKALANDKFPTEAIFNWTYADEQKAKRDWHSETGDENPYANLPKLNLYTYQMSEIIKDEVEQGVEINGETEEYAFDLNEFFLTKNGSFVHDASVDKFLDALTTLHKFPFSTPELRSELKHTFWLLNRVDSAKALARKLENHPIFKKEGYKIILAAGDGRLEDDSEETQKSFDKVTAAIKNFDKTITLSVGQLTTGVTIPEWTAVLMLSSLKSPSLYMQAAFRAQNPCLFKSGTGFLRKQNAYVFDFDPARTLTIFEEFANDLSSETSDGRGDADTRKQNVRALLNFFPVIGEDEQGEMVELDAERVLSIPRKIRSQEVVRRGFMSNFLFQNISNVFNAPQEIIDIITQLQPLEEPKVKTEIPPDAAETLNLDEEGNVALDDSYIIGRSMDVFGDKIFGETITPENFVDTVTEVSRRNPAPKDEKLEALKSAFQQAAVKPILDTAKTEYTDGWKPSEQKRLERKLAGDADRIISRTYESYSIDQKNLEAEKQKQLAVTPPKDHAAVQREFEQREDELAAEFKKTMEETYETFKQNAAQEVVRTVETQQKEQEKGIIENTIRNHLRGFSRTIPSFLMAYGNSGIRLANFDKIIPDDVFKEVTSISLDDFRFLRDGGDYKDAQTGETKHFGGHLFEPVVFDDSVQEFLNLRKKLANYFDESSKEDIFDYIPPQKTNQIFTPKKLVRQMVDMLEAENPGCFDDSEKTFIDLYMKSGLYITEIVKRLYNSEAIKQLYPDSTARLKHIFEKQVYGLAPTEIIYKIATNFILGFDEQFKEEAHNFKQADALPYAREGTLETLLERLY